jgi:hypothetical protein
MQYDFNLTANAATVLGVKGKFFKYKSGLGAVRVRNNKGGYIDLLPGQGVWGLDYSELTITDISGANNYGVMIAGDFDFHDDRISGTVDVVDGGKNRVMAGKEFSIAMNVTAGATTYATLELYNPSVAKNIIVSQIIISSSNSSPLRIGIAPSAIFGNGATGQSKMGGGAVSAGVASGGAAVSFPPAGFSYLGVFNVQANQAYTYQLKTPIVLPFGYGLVVQSSQVNTDMNLVVEYGEDLI